MIKKKEGPVTSSGIVYMYMSKNYFFLPSVLSQWIYAQACVACYFQFVCIFSVRYESSQLLWFPSGLRWGPISGREVTQEGKKGWEAWYQVLVIF